MGPLGALVATGMDGPGFGSVDVGVDGTAGLAFVVQSPQFSVAGIVRGSLSRCGQRRPIEVHRLLAFGKVVYRIGLGELYARVGGHRGHRFFGGHSGGQFEVEEVSGFGFAESGRRVERAQHGRTKIVGHRAR